MFYLKSREDRRQIKSSRKRIMKETRIVAKELKRLEKEHKKNGLKAMRNYQLLMDGINELIDIYKDYNKG